MQHITLIIGGQHKLHHIQLNPMRLLLSGIALAISILLCISIIWQHYHEQMISLRLQLAQHNPTQTHRQIESLRSQAQQQLIVLAGRVGTIQAQMGRLNALGERLTQDASLDKSEFNFSKLPPMGGVADTASLADVNFEELLQLIGQLESELPHRKQQFKTLDSMMARQSIAKEAYISGKPVPEVRGTWLSSPYGMRMDPFTKRPAMHRGVDFAGKEGTHILATGAGVVVFAGKRIGYGLTVDINHGNGLVTRYAHAAKLKAKSR